MNYRIASNFLIIDRINDPINLFDLIKLHPNYNYNKYAVLLGVSEATIKRRIKQLKEEGKIVRKGENKNGYWEVISY